MTKCLKLIDDTNQWSETASDVSNVIEQRFYWKITIGNIAHEDTTW